MASGGRREFPVQRLTDEEPPPITDGSKYSFKNATRTGNDFSTRDGDGRRRSSPRKKDYTPPHRVRENTKVKSKSAGRGRGIFAGERAALSGGAFQLESAARRGTRGYGERSGEVRSPGRKEEVRVSPRKAGSSGREERGCRKRGEEGGQRDKFNKCEETVSEAIQLWREERPGYSDLENLVTSVWQQYLSVMEDSVERAVKENIVMRVWRGLHYPIIEMLRKLGQSERGCVCVCVRACVRACVCVCVCVCCDCNSDV